jgi:hypothetical protein
MNNVALPQVNEVKYLGMLLDRSETYQHEEKTTQSEVQKNVLATGKTINTIDRKQITFV